MSNKQFTESLFQKPENRGRHIDLERPGRTISSVMNELSQAIAAEDDELAGGFYVFQELREQLWPRRGTIACYVVKGGNEGFYVHIEVIDHRERPATALWVAHWKLWSWKSASDVAMRSVLLLDAYG